MKTKVVGQFIFLVRVMPSVGMIENLQFAMVMNRILGALIDRIIYLHYSSLVSTAVTIIGSRKDSDDLSVVLPLVPFHDKLMGA